MSQYGYIPASRIDDVELSYSRATPSSWKFSKNGQQYGGMEEVFFTTEQKQEITSLGGQWFESAAAFSSWMNTHDDTLTQVIADRQFGQELLNIYLSENKDLHLTTTQSLQQLSKFGAAKQLLEAGAITAVLDIISSITVDDVFTQERKDAFIARIASYLEL